MTMKNLKRYILTAAAGLMILPAAWAENVVMHLPSGFQVLGMSPNGKWACGVFVDAGLNTYSFRWNLESGTYELIDTETGTAMDVANDGTVVGDFNDPDVMSNGAPVPMPGYWRDGYWHHLEMPAGAILDGFGGGITADGHYMTGNISVDGRYQPFIWKDGKIHRSLDTGKDAVAYAVAPGGDGAAGFSTQYNRTACYWAPDGRLVYFMDSPDYSQSPWNYCRNFSPDGTKLLYWGGWEVSEDETVYLYSIYDINTGERVKVTAPNKEADLEFFDISNSGILVGQNVSRGYVWAGDQGMYIDDYLLARGVDLSKYDDFYSNGDYYSGQLPVSRVVAISEDEKVLAMNYYNRAGEASSMVVKIDYDATHITPAEVAARQLDGLNTVGVTWKRPVGVSAVRGYNVYRDGKKVSGFMPLNVPYFYDRNLAPGTYTYEVSALTTAGVETRAEAMTVTVSPAAPQAPLNMFARQRGINDALLTWEAPMSAMAHQRYYDPAKIEYNGFAIYSPVEIEMAVRFDKAEMANYADHMISEVSFIPMADHPEWTVNIYTYNTEGALTLVASQPVTQPLNMRALNTVRFDQPVAVPDGDVVVAVKTYVGAELGQVIGIQAGKNIPGYSDLLRQTSEPDFFSTFDASLESSLTLTTMTWAIDLGLQGADGTDTTIDHYNLYVDGVKTAETTALRHVIGSLDDGDHTIGVEAVYADMSASPVTERHLTIAQAYPTIDQVDLTLENVTTPTVTATWQAPVDNDLRQISYTTAQQHSLGIKGNETNSYSLMVASQYPAAMLRGYEGYRLNTVRFYPLTDALFTFILYAGDQEVYHYEVEDYKIKQWNEYTIPDEVLIDANTDYRLVIDCFDPVPDTALMGIDDQAPRTNVSDLFSTDNGETWQSLSVETGSRGNWLMGMTIVDGGNDAVAVEGYDVVIDNQVVNGAPVAETSYTHDFGKYDTKSHTISINARYAGVTEAVKGRSQTFKLAVSGISDVASPVIDILKGQDEIEVTCAGVRSLALIAADGRTVSSAQGSVISTAALAAGVYVLEIKCDNTVITRKIQISK